MNYLIAPKVDKFLHAQSKNVQDKFFEILGLLIESNGRLRDPYCKKVAKYIFELRIKSKYAVRVFFTYNINYIIFFHGYVKKTRKIPQKELKQAKKVLKMIVDKYNI